MAEETPPTIPLSTPEEGPNGSDPKEPPVGLNISDPATKDHTPDRSLENTSGDPVMQIVVHNFEQINSIPGRLPYSVHGNYERSQATRFHITLSGPAWFWYDNLLPGSINGFHELRDKFRENFLQQRRFQKKKKPKSLEFYNIQTRRFFKDLTARPSVSMEDLFTQAHNFIRVDEANTENRPRDGKWGTADGRHIQNHQEALRKHKERYAPRPTIESPAEIYTTFSQSKHSPTFTPLIESLAKIYTTFEGKSILRPPSRMFAPAHRRDRTCYCEFHSDHDHVTNNCIDLRKEIETCVRNGRLSHLAKAQNNSQDPIPSNTLENGKNQIVGESQGYADISFTRNDLISKHCSGDDPLANKAKIKGCVIHRVYLELLLLGVFVNAAA
nr:hypothetical protein [Tanacetum cinerariifolium]